MVIGSLSLENQFDRVRRFTTHFSKDAGLVLMRPSALREVIVRADRLLGAFAT